VDGKPTMTLSGVNVQIVDGSGHTSTVNGPGTWCWGITSPRAASPGRTI
jgi:hypothetical protein